MRPLGVSVCYECVSTYEGLSFLLSLPCSVSNVGAFQLPWFIQIKTDNIPSKLVHGGTLEHSNADTCKNSHVYLKQSFSPSLLQLVLISNIICKKSCELTLCLILHRFSFCSGGRWTRWRLSHEYIQKSSKMYQTREEGYLWVSNLSHPLRRIQCSVFSTSYGWMCGCKASRVSATSDIKHCLCYGSAGGNSFRFSKQKQNNKRLLSVGERCEWRRDKHKERQAEGIDIDRNCPGLFPGLLSGRVCARLSACLSSPLLSILLKTICLLIIHSPVFRTDMFSLHRYFHCSSNVPFSPGKQEGDKPAPERKKYLIGNFLDLGLCHNIIWTPKTNGHNLFYHGERASGAVTVASLPLRQGDSSHITVAFATEFNFL